MATFFIACNIYEYSLFLLFLEENLYIQPTGKKLEILSVHYIVPVFNSWYDFIRDILGHISFVALIESKIVYTVLWERHVPFWNLFTIDATLQSCGSTVINSMTNLQMSYFFMIHPFKHLLLGRVLLLRDSCQTYFYHIPSVSRKFHFFSITVPSIVCASLNKIIESKSDHYLSSLSTLSLLPATNSFILISRLIHNNPFSCSHPTLVVLVPCMGWNLMKKTYKLYHYSSISMWFPYEKSYYSVPLLFCYDNTLKIRITIHY